MFCRVSSGWLNFECWADEVRAAALNGVFDILRDYGKQIFDEEECTKSTTWQHVHGTGFIQQVVPSLRQFYGTLQDMWRMVFNGVPNQALWDGRGYTGITGADVIRSSVCRGNWEPGFHASILSRFPTCTIRCLQRRCWPPYGLKLDLHDSLYAEQIVQNQYFEVIKPLFDDIHHQLAPQSDHKQDRLPTVLRFCTATPL